MTTTPSRLDWRTKGLPPRAEGLTGDEIGTLGLNLLSGDLMMPVAVIREAALHHNITAMQAFADRIGAKLCPHGKTSMSPELFAMQFKAGAWGLTAATAHHVRIYRRLGVERIFMASQLVAPADVEFVLGELATDPDFDFYCLVDSPEAASLLAEGNPGRPVQVLIETGDAGGRAGLRDVESAVALARHIAAFPQLALRGLETFEGIHDARPEAGSMIDLAIDSARAIAETGLFARGPMLLSAGGSAFLDLCAAKLPARIGDHDVLKIIRPGCYVTHDSGTYERKTKPDGVPLPGLPHLHHALEVWSVVLSVPEPGRAIVGAGKRDLSSDVGLPVALWRHRSGDDLPRRAEGMEVLHLWDQHLALRHAPDMLAVGDLIGFGISHPCSTFDRWTAMQLVDESYRVTGAITTLF